ncbi:MAG: hypothetical protein IT319_14620 [Anaerolineae bacterium]|nr:hypothetical protein [Anaerolineae bacterium]
MQFLKRLFGGVGGGDDSAGLYYYIRLKGSDEVVRVRINRNNDLSLADDGKTFWVHKMVMGTKGFQRAEVDLYFNQNRQLSSSEISGGDLVTAAEYEAWVASQAESS